MQNPVQTPIVPNVPTSMPQIPASQAQMPGPNAPANDSKKVILWFVIGLVIIFLVVGTIYFFLSKQQPTNTQAPTTQASPFPVAQQDLSSELNSINVDPSGVNNDFAAVDQDLQQL